MCYGYVRFGVRSTRGCVYDGPLRLLLFVFGRVPLKNRDKIIVTIQFLNRLRNFCDFSKIETQCTFIIPLPLVFRTVWFRDRSKCYAFLIRERKHVQTFFFRWYKHRVNESLSYFRNLVRDYPSKMDTTQPAVDLLQTRIGKPMYDLNFNVVFSTGFTNFISKRSPQ